MAKWVEVTKNYDLQTRKGQLVAFKAGDVVYIPDDQAESLLAADAAKKSQRPERTSQTFKDE